MDDLALGIEGSLSRNGFGGMLAPFLFADGTEAAPGAAWSNAPGTGFYRDGVDGSLVVTIQGTKTFRWSTSAGVQIWDAGQGIWVDVLTSISDGTVPDGDTDNQLVKWDQTGGLGWQPGFANAVEVVFDPTGLSIITASEVDGALTELDGAVITNQGSITGHTGTTNIHFTDAPVDGVTYSRKDGGWVISSTGVSDHNALNGLTVGDDHTQYHNDARGDARYYQLATKVDDSTLWDGFTIVVGAAGSDPNTIYFVPE
jgi:hypothetical protein